jgi:hypothetical protein
MLPRPSGRRSSRSGKRRFRCAGFSTKHAAGRHDGAIYIGRGSKWGNPFRIGVDGDRAAVIAKHARWLGTSYLLRAVDELRGKDLLCFCAPKPGHGDLLLRLANATCEERVAWWRSAA